MRNLISAALLAGAMLAPAAAMAQSGDLPGRVDKLEREMRAVQRTVFPGGAGKYVQPEITPPDPVLATPGTPATSAVADLETRVTAIERQQTTLTGQIEQTQFRIRQLEDSFAAYKKATDARLTALEGGVGVAPAVITPSGEGVDISRPPATPRPGPAPATAKNDPGRADRVAAIERPDSGEPVEDAYLYGYRLWEAKLYPEAEGQLKSVAEKYPKHRRASYAQNLLGRAYLDEGRPSLASMAFYDSFKKFPDGERAPDSLYFLGQALVKLGKPADACKVYAELDASYGAKLTPELKARVNQGRADAKCK